MNEDLLSRATRAARATTPPDDERGSATRARVMASLHKGRIRRRTQLALILPIAATFAAATALGASGGRFGHWVQIIEQVLEHPSSAPTSRASTSAAPTPAGPHPVAAEPVAAPLAADPPPAVPSPIVAVPPASPHSTTDDAPAVVAEPPPAHDAPRVHAHDAPPHRANPAAAPATASSMADADSETSPAGALYRAAHHAHFVSHDAGAALRGWDAYLAAAPHGRFELEARYNRALCLLRLGKTAEARDALAPFAEGRYGDYRRKEAGALLERLGN
jgi:hypothetical protein